jgi:YebC/PmpR family DNA-binding regulatory protein
MSGHSKWSSIKHKKGAADAKRGQLFTKLTRALIVAAKDGGPDPAANLALQNAIEKARAASMPKDNIERAIARGSGTGADATAYEQISYEGYGPGGVAVYVDVLTDNRNRTAGDVRHIFARHDGNLAESGAVAWLFERKGVVLVNQDSTDEDELTLTAADAGAEDVAEEGSSFEVTCAPEDLHRVREALEAAGIAVAAAEVTMLPKTTVAIEDEVVARKVLKLIDGLEEYDDVQDVYANFDIPEHVLETVVV